MAEVLGAFEQAVLLAIMQLGNNAYGRTVLRKVNELLGRDASAGSVYTTLDRLETRRLIRSQLAEGTPARGGRARRYYSVEAEGVRALNEAYNVLSGMWRSMEWPAKAR
jgi:DNA-binding PadR family transcriptional regulator